MTETAGELRLVASAKGGVRTPVAVRVGSSLVEAQVGGDDLLALVHPRGTVVVHPAAMLPATCAESAA